MLYNPLSFKFNKLKIIFFEKIKLKNNPIVLKLSYNHPSQNRCFPMNSIQKLLELTSNIQ